MISSLHCPNGHGEINEEGFLCKRIINEDGSEIYREIGKQGLVISQGNTSSQSMATLLETISRLESPEVTQSDVVDFAEASARKWNKKRAKRRFNRWLRQAENDLPPIRDARLHDLAQRLVEDARSRIDNSPGWTSEDVLRWGGNGFLCELKAYEIRRDGEPVLLVRSDLPVHVIQAFKQARECYRWGLDAASFGLCRIVLDIVVSLIDERKRDISWPQPVREEFRSILNCVPSDLFSDAEKRWASTFWARTSAFLHGRGMLPGEDDACDALQNTATILDRLATRGAFKV